MQNILKFLTKRNIIKTIIFFILLILIFFIIKFVFEYITTGKLNVQSQNNKISIYSDNGAPILSNTHNISTKLKPGIYYISVDSNIPKKIQKTIEIKARTTQNIQLNTNDAYPAIPVYKAETKAIFSDSSGLGAVTATGDVIHIMPNDTTTNNTNIDVYDAGFYNSTSGYIVSKSKQLYLMSDDRINKIDTPNNINLGNYKMLVLSYGNLLLWDNARIYIYENGIYKTIYEAEKEANISSVSAGLEGIFLNKNTIKDDSYISTVIYLSYSGETKKSISFTSEYVERRGEADQDIKINNIILKSSPSSKNVFINNNEKSYIYNDSLELLAILPTNYIRTVHWVSDNELLYSEGENIYKYLLSDPKSEVITSSAFNKNISDIVVYSNYVFFVSANSKNEQLIQGQNINTPINNEQSKILSTILPIKHQDCTANFLYSQTNTIYINNPNSGCYNILYDTLNKYGIDKKDVLIEETNK